MKIKTALLVAIIAIFLVMILAQVKPAHSQKMVFLLMLTKKLPLVLTELLRASTLLSRVLKLVL